MIKERSNTTRPDTPNEEIDQIFASLNEEFRNHTTLDMSFRKTQLASLRRGFVEMEDELLQALKEDLHSSPMDAYLGNLATVKGEIDCSLKHMDSWAAVRNKKTPMTLFPGRSFYRPQPKGVALVIGSWNYPISTLLAPVVSAIAAGNAVVIKPSEFAPHTSIVVKKLCDEYLDNRLYRVVEGGVQTGSKLTSLAFDVLCFTGSTYVGKIIARAASANLTPCILELGGKCPIVIDHTANLEMAAKRIASLKYYNCGQTCIAPDYIFVHAKIKNKFIQILKEKIDQFFSKNPKTNSNYSRMIHSLHTQRVADLLKGHEDKVIHGDLSSIDAQGKYIPPIVVDEPDRNSPLMQEEIFGPILPIFEYKKPQDVIQWINDNPRPLALYYYGNPDSVFSTRLMEWTDSGAYLTNDNTIHYAHNDLSFGGTGASGYGRIHGQEGFDDMSHLKPILLRPNSSFLDMDDRYPIKDGDKRLKFIKSVEFLGNVYYEDVMCWVKCIGGIVGLFFLWKVLQAFGMTIDVNISFNQR